MSACIFPMGAVTKPLIVRSASGSFATQVDTVELQSAFPNAPLLEAVKLPFTGEIALPKCSARALRWMTRGLAHFTNVGTFIPPPDGSAQAALELCDLHLGEEAVQAFLGIYKASAADSPCIHVPSPRTALEVFCWAHLRDGPLMSDLTSVMVQYIGENFSEVSAHEAFLQLRGTSDGVALDCALDDHLALCVRDVHQQHQAFSMPNKYFSMLHYLLRIGLGHRSVRAYKASQGATLYSAVVGAQRADRILTKCEIRQRAAGWHQEFDFLWQQWAAVLLHTYCPKGAIQGPPWALRGLAQAWRLTGKPVVDNVSRITFSKGEQFKMQCIRLEWRSCADPLIFWKRGRGQWNGPPPPPGWLLQGMDSELAPSAAFRALLQTRDLSLIRFLFYQPHLTQDLLESLVYSNVECIAATVVHMADVPLLLQLLECCGADLQNNLMQLVHREIAQL